MMPAYVLMFKWLLAGVSCALAGLASCCLLNAAQRVWPALRARRAVWLAAQIVVAGAALLPFLPHGERISVAPAVTLGAEESAAIRLALEDGGDQHDDADQSGHDGAVAGPSLSSLGAPSVLAVALPILWATLYAAGLAYALARLLRARTLWNRLLMTARRLSRLELLAHGAFSEPHLSEIARSRLAVMETDAAISPMLIGLRRPVLLLPRHLREFSGEQQRMIVAHELHHWRVRDPLCLSVSAALQTVFWFNPALRWLGAKMTWALELACDQHVLAGRPQQQRKLYAAALLRQWKAQVAMPSGGGVAFGGINGDTIAARILQMQKTSPPAPTTLATWTVAVLMAAVLAGGAVLQPALAFNIERQAKAVAETVEPPAATPDFTPWRNPLDRMRVAGFFGVQRSVSDQPHHGVDLAAPKGTPIYAAAAGTVIATGELAENNGRYGTVVVIETGSLQTLYAHLNSVAVKAGDRVAAGQPIGAVGETGFATGPHLHFEVRRHNQPIDPATVLADLDAHATKHALKVRRQQLGY
ncbi:beta-lactamase regulating signal transducer with metallopeptidase domain [Duganella sp. 1411]|uniref:M23/M56 family metallopeptidase n=1 Tax=Duganella sp. 1411 TaxID=2806572 RepID=UPI001AE2B1C9|nr:M23/M56 family metallopeptidase [Duganella sp. 1411]MBP1204864.1 beta-lactamase regulating signal transducer with metallopeptidase domain [Duganella sp. 1411]